MFDRNRWLARLSWSFFIIAAVLVWKAYQERRNAPPESRTVRIVLYLAGAACAAALGAAGVRARHRGDWHD